ncbi:MAG: FAD-dependent oxidoreductase, partial [Candidatus Omnitrophica bacterium]|nr:FAD-dependent oxidoreductase [Candidatus Omnitrophota bacterium]
DICGHLLHFKHHYAFSLVRDLLGDNLAEHKKSAWIYSHGAYTRYPFQANLYGLPHSVVKECLLGFIQKPKNGLFKKGRNNNFLHWINDSFGGGVAKHFMVPYNTKFWTVSPSSLTCEWLDGIIPVPSLGQVIEGSVDESKRQFGYNARFWYPRNGGINQLPDALARRIKGINTNCEVVQIDTGKKEIKTRSGTSEKFDYLISTIPLPELGHMIKGLTGNTAQVFKKLRFNSVFNLNLGIKERENLDKHWVYFPQREIPFFRAGFFHNFSSYIAPAGRGSMYIETSYSKESPLRGNQLVPRIKQGLRKTGALNDNANILQEDINDIRYAYPIYDRNYKTAREDIFKYLNLYNIIPCGRYGSWRYMSMEDVIIDGKNIGELFL